MNTLGRRWRAARPPVAGLHLDSAACSRQSRAALDAAAAHCQSEAQVGGYVAAAAAEDTLALGRAGVAALTGMDSDDVVFTTGARSSLDLLLSSWVDERRLIACLPGEFGPNLAVMAANGFATKPLATDSFGRTRAEDVRAVLVSDAPALVHLVAVPSHRGIAQPVAEIAEVCRVQGVPLVVDAAQALGHIDCTAAADAVYSTSRKWLAGPRGVGVLAVKPDLATRLRPRIRPPDWSPTQPALPLLAGGEANIAAQVGFSIAVREHLADDPILVRDRLAEVGRLTRSTLADLSEWRVVEPLDSPTAITTLAPRGDVDVNWVRSELISRHGVVTTAAGPDRAPLELAGPVLRLSPHVDTTGEELARFADALSAVSRGAWGRR